MDDVAQYNQARWKALVEARALFTRPWLDLDAVSAREIVDPNGRLGELSGKDVLCLAGGGGQHSAAFALLGANVTVVDLSAEQLERDLEVAEAYGVSIAVLQADMRDLASLKADGFDIICQPYSLNFVPDCKEVFIQVKRVLRNRGLYRLHFANPFTMGTNAADWNGAGYLLNEPYLQGAVITYDDQDWVYDRSLSKEILKPVEYRHTLSTVINRLVELGFSIQHVSDNSDIHPNVNSAPGTWDHFVAFAPPWLVLLARLEY